VRHHATKSPLVASLLLLLFGAAEARCTGTALLEPLRALGDARLSDGSTVILARNQSEEDALLLTTALAGSTSRPVLLFDSSTSTKYARAFLHALGTQSLVLVDPHPDATPGLAQHYGVSFTATVPSAAVFTSARRVVVAPASERRLVLHAACLAGAFQARLVIAHDKPGEIKQIKRSLAEWQTEEVVAVGGAAKALGKLGGMHVVKLSDEAAVSAAYLKQQLKNGPITTLVVANPNDINDDLGSMSTLAPWVALQKRAALVLTNDAGSDAEEVIGAALQHDSLARAESLLFVAALKAVPMKKRPNPIPDGRDREIEMEPMTPEADVPCSFATGRMFHPDRGVLSLMLARQRLLERETAPKALIVSNPGGGLPLLETFSRNTANEFKNAGYVTSAFFGAEANKEAVRKLLPQQNIFLWEGHHSTLVGTYGIHQWAEPLKPSLVFLQSCLALAEPKAHPFLQRGAVGVVGSSTRTYSGSGGAFALAFFDTLLYEDQSLGGSLRQAKNFMLAFAQLKQRRFGAESKLGGANVRSAWAFTLWGDPTLRMPRPARPAEALPSVRHVVQGNTIVVTLPDAAHDTVESAKYQAAMRPNARLAGLVSKQQGSDVHRLVPFVFAEVDLPKAVPGKTPQLRTKLPETHWVFCYDGRLRRGYLLVTPRQADRGELRFQVAWE
jgi:hypothetical protein